MTSIEIRMFVDEIFDFDDGRVVFVGHVKPDVEPPFSGGAHLIVDGRVLTAIAATPRMQGRNRVGRAVEVVNHSLDVPALRRQSVEIVWNLAESPAKEP